MSIGVGNHNYVPGYSITGPYSMLPKAICPWCGDDACEADWCDVDVGYVQCGPFHCQACGASEMAEYDVGPERTVLENHYGWFKPGSKPSPYANTVDGKLVSHTEAKQAYVEQRLDLKPGEIPYEERDAKLAADSFFDFLDGLGKEDGL